MKRIEEDGRGKGASGELVFGAIQDDGNANDGDDDAYNEVIERLSGIR